MRLLLLPAMILLVGTALCHGVETTLQQENSLGKTEAAPQQSMRRIVDLAGNTILLPPAQSLKRIVIIAPPLVSTFASLGIDHARIVGAHKIAFDDANHGLLDRILPYWKEIPTAFLTGYTANTEALLNLHPDVIFVYGNFQKKGLRNIEIPVVDFITTTYDNELWSVAIERLMKKIFQKENATPSVEIEWKTANDRVGVFLKKRSDEKRKGLMIMNNTMGKIMVRGGGSYGDDWLIKSGLINVAAHLTGERKEVSMEDIYTWNPDVVYVFRGRPASDYLAGNMKNQDWSFVKAYKDKAIYDCPRGVINWGAPSADSPLMLQWMVLKNFRESCDEAGFPAIMKKHYKDLFNIILSDDLIDSILFPNGRARTGP